MSTLNRKILVIFGSERNVLQDWKSGQDHIIKMNPEQEANKEKPFVDSHNCDTGALRDSSERLTMYEFYVTSTTPTTWTVKEAGNETPGDGE